MWIKAFLTGLVIGFSSVGYCKSIVVVGGAGSEEYNFTTFLDSKEHINSIHYLPMTINPFRADHRIDLASAIDLVGRVTKGGERVYLVAYSIGSKVAFKVAMQFADSLAALVLIDPVDGPPPFTPVSEKFPIWTQTFPVEELSGLDTYIYASDVKFSRGLFGVACVPRATNFTRFKASIPHAKLYYLEGVSHTDFLAPPLTAQAFLACRRGAADKAEAARKLLFNDWQKILKNDRR